MTRREIEERIEKEWIGRLKELKQSKDIWNIDEECVCFLKSLLISARLELEEVRQRLAKQIDLEAFNSGITIVLGENIPSNTIMVSGDIFAKLSKGFAAIDAVGEQK